jgi:hypothetical protein
MVGACLHHGNAQFSHRNTPASAAAMRGFPAARIIRGSAPSVARLTGIGRAPTPSAARSISGQRLPSQPTASKREAHP